MFVKITNGQVAQYPYTAGDLRRDNPNVSFPKNIPNGVFAKYGAYPVGYQAAPDYDPLTHRLEHSNLPEREVTGYYTEEDAPIPEMVGEPIHSGRWVLTKTVVALTDEQIADATAAKGKEVRKKRDALLAETDWIITKETEQAARDGLGLQIPSVWLDYRQALRDITDHASFPYLGEDDWPVKP